MITSPYFFFAMADLVDSLNRLIFETSPLPAQPLSSVQPREYFPLQVVLEKDQNGSWKLVKLEIQKNRWRWVPAGQNAEVHFLNKSQADAAVESMLARNWTVAFDYSKFVSHPGTLFVKNLARLAVLAEKLREFFNEKSRFGLVEDVNIINLGPNDDDEVSAILKFENYLDVDHIVAKLPLGENPFHTSLPLYVNRYVSKRERAMCPDATVSVSEDAILYDTLVVENLGEFFSRKLKIDDVEGILAKFTLFGLIDSVYLPLAPSSEEYLSFRKVGFISFAHERSLNQDILRCLYYLRDLSFEEFEAFDENAITDIKKDVESPARAPDSLDTPRLRVSIAQRKHNHHLYESAECLYVHNEPGLLKVKMCDPLAADEPSDVFLNKFMKASNYQETNVYVKNLPVLFENDDELWAQFWNQFGVDGVKSAKIIKPQFYSKKPDELLGRIGFVFYKEFKMALRAIILTNNKIVSLGNGPGMVVQASFAIQKHNSSLGSGKLALSSLSLNLSYNYYSDGYGKRYSAPMNDPSFYMHEHRLSNAPSPGALPFVPPEQYYYYPYYMPMAPPEQPMKEEENGMGHSPKQKAGQINAPHFPNPMGYMYNPYYQMPQPMMNGLGPYFNNYSMRQGKKGERKKSS